MRSSRRKSGPPALGVVACYWWALRDRQLAWDGTEQEARGPQPGDELLDHADLTATRAITIGAPIERVWPPLIEPVAAVSFVMTRRMLRGIRLRAEQEPLRSVRERAGATG
ncbi:hypothetical protein [Sphaerisporangium dianthi]|uniref:Uncharacterized protein n=1 Tax=Sphaerisporangium dianthi TaxID=1436120 RepID=A0ABV9CNK8_9ACTN